MMHLISDRRNNLRENETISIQPILVLRIEGHELIEENMGRRGQTHGRAGMTGIGFEGSIDLYHEDRLAGGPHISNSAAQSTRGR